MLEVYSTNIEVAADAAIPFNNIHISKGCSAIESAPSTIQLNRCGVYEVNVDATADTDTTIQLTKNGVLQPQAQSTGTTLGFTTYVQVPENNTNCCCTSPTTIQLINTEATTFTNVNCTVKKFC